MRRKKAKAIGSVIALAGMSMVPVTMMTSAAHAQCDLVETTHATAPDPADFDYFGRAVSIDGAWAAIGKLGDDDVADRAGAVWMYRRNGQVWEAAQKLTAPDGAATDEFGKTVRVRGNRMIIGAPNHDGKGENAGAAYIFRNVNGIWTFITKIEAADGDADDLFGSVVDIEGDLAMATSVCDNENGPHAGAAYLFERQGTTFVQVEKVIAPDGEALDYFGVAAVLKGGRLLIGAYADDDDGEASGSVYAFERSEGNFGAPQKITASDAAEEDLFGASVDVDGDTLVIGAYGDDDGDENSGAVYIFKWNGEEWIESEKIIASDPGIEDVFGSSVAVSGNLLLVGAWADDEAAANSGAAYVYRLLDTGAEEALKILPTNPVPFGAFGFGLDMDGSTICIGSHFVENEAIIDAGAATFYEVDCFDLCLMLNGDCNENGVSDLEDIFLNHTSSDCNDNGIPDECDIANGFSQDENENGIPDECDAECLGDLNGDGMVDSADLLILFSVWGLCG